MDKYVLNVFVNMYIQLCGDNSISARPAIKVKEMYHGPQYAR